MTEGMIIAYIVQWFVLIILMILVYNLMKVIGKFIQMSESQKKDSNNNISMYEGPPLNTTAPIIKSQLIGGNEYFILDNSTNDDNRNLVLIFLAPGCKSCEELLKGITDVGKFKNTRLIGIINPSGKKKEDILTYADHLNRINIVSISSENLDKNYKINLFPYGILMNNERKILGKSPLHNEEMLINLINANEKNRIA